MVIFLTSSFVKYQPMHEYVPHPLNASNNFEDNLRKYWVPNTRFLIFASDPLDEKLANHLTTEMQYAFSMADFSISEVRCRCKYSVVKVVLRTEEETLVVVRTIRRRGLLVIYNQTIELVVVVREHL